MGYEYQAERPKVITEEAWLKLILLYHEMKTTFAGKKSFTLEDCENLKNKDCCNWTAVAQIDRLAELGLIRHIDTFLRDDAPLQYKAYIFTS